MSIQVDQTQIHCSFCARTGHSISLVRSMHGLYCTNDKCYSRVTDGNLVPASTCEKCKENAFYVESDGTLETAAYVCIACGYEELI